MNDPHKLKARVLEKAHELGFDLVGITGAEPPPHLEVYRAWLQSGRHASMEYLAAERALARRADPRRILPECRSIIVTGTYYQPARHETAVTSDEARLASYALGDDYHRVLTERMQELARTLEAELEQPFAYRIYTDTGPLLERELAMRAGLGWIGKNTCLINPQHGSFLLLAEMLLDLELPPDQPFTSDHCGTCTRCIEACPTGCILPDRTLDAGRCLSYLTIEEKGAIPEPLRNAIGDWLFGCDICQEVCPWNIRFGRLTRDPAFQPRATVDPIRLAGFLALEQGSWRAGLRGSPLERPRRRGLVRNAAVVAGNTGRKDLLSLLERIMLTDGEPIVREHAAWAIARIARASAMGMLLAALAGEKDERTRKGIWKSLDLAEGK